MTQTPCEPLEAEFASEAAAALSGRGFALVSAGRVRAALECRVGASSGTWPAFAASWDALPRDDHMADGGRYRFRRFAALRARVEGRQTHFDPLPHRPFFQSAGYNELNGGVPRSFEPIAPETLANPVLQALVGACHDVVRRVAAAPAWEVELHPIRTRAFADQQGLATPEGIHRDGVDYFFVVLLRRQGLRGAASLVFDERRHELLRYSLEEPFEMLAVDDTRTFHCVTPFVASAPGTDALRDVIVINFRDLSRPDRRRQP